MGRRREQRTFILLPVTVRGIDTFGKPFEIPAETCDVSDFGARLRGLSSIASLGKKIEVECKGQKAWYAIQWIGQPGTRSAKQVGIRLLDPGKYIWGVPSKQWAPDTFDDSEPGTEDRINNRLNGFRNGGNELERRRFPRMPFRVETQITTEGSHARMPGKITDISLGGCYVDLVGPLPVGEVIGLDLKAGLNNLHLFGTVRSSQPGLGMGIEFAKMSASDFATLEGIIGALPGRKSVSNSRKPVLDVEVGRAGYAKAESPSAATLEFRPAATPETFGAVMRLLLRKGLLTSAELAEEIESLKNERVGSAL